ncbi:pectinesterase [Xylariomycetidae sp. FL2044]|nr:pectinesterase [Xylariomycetidae sp. FL2044]
MKLLQRFLQRSPTLFQLLPFLFPVVQAASHTAPPAGCLHVAKSGGAYTSVQSAINTLSTSSTTDQCIFVDQGTYNEQVYVAARSARLTIYGYTEDTTSYSGNKAVLIFNNHADVAQNNDATGTLRVHADGVKVYNLNVVNSYGKGDQAIALSAQADSGYYGCQFYGFQDTLLANEGYQYYRGCMVTGATDFIFGQRAAAWFEDCDIRVRNSGYYITANGRDSSTNPSYYLFNNCDVAAAPGETVTAGTYYLGRPWRAYARVVFQNTGLSSVINGAGWSRWNGDADVGNVYYGEYGNTGLGASGTRASFSQKLGSAVALSTVLGSGFAGAGWFDATYPGDDGGSESAPSATLGTSTATPAPTGCAALYGQCGGMDWAGATCCEGGSCTFGNDWYSQCS